MNIKQVSRLSLYLLLVLMVFSCHSGKQETVNDKNHGSVVITADSNLQYILEQLVPVYENFYPGTKVSFSYTSEDIAISDFKHKKNTIIAVGRLLSPEEMANAAHNHDAKILEKSGAGMLVMEVVPAKLAKKVTQALSIPTIGIGAGPDCSGQVLVLHDMLGISQGKKPRFVKDFMLNTNSIHEAVTHYVQAVKAGQFPSKEHQF